MAIFQRWTLTDRGKALIAKAQAERCTIHFTAARTGDGAWTDEEDMRGAEDIRSRKQTFAFSAIDIPDGNPATVVLEIIINNLQLAQLYYLTELGIYANDPDEGEILYLIATSQQRSVYVPANNGIGISTIVERINLEVADSANVTINTTGAVVGASDFLALQRIIEVIRAALSGGEEGQHLIKAGPDDFDAGWQSFIPVTTKAAASFPEVGQENAVYIDPNTSKIYVWIDTPDEETPGHYFELPLGAEASQNLQEQITANRNAIAALTTRVAGTEKALFRSITLAVPAEEWTVATESGVLVYTNEITVEGMTEETPITAVWPHTISITADDIVNEQKARSIFFGHGRAFADTDAVILKCYGKAPDADFGIELQGVEEVSS